MGDVRTAGYAAIGDYAAVGDGRACALVARDGTIDWFALPRLDSAPVLFALLDSRSGGCFELAPEAEFEVAREYFAKTNVLTTTFHTQAGSVRVTDAVALHELGLLPWVELVRRVEGLSGSVPMRWRLRPRFDWGETETRFERRRGAQVAVGRELELALHTWEAGEPEQAGGEVWGRFTARPGSQALLVLTSAHEEPIVFPVREEVERRLERTADLWRGWLASGSYEGDWREAVERSALVLKLLTYAPTGGMARRGHDLTAGTGRRRSQLRLPLRLAARRRLGRRRVDQPWSADAGTRLLCLAAARDRRDAPRAEALLPARRSNHVRPPAHA